MQRLSERTGVWEAPGERNSARQGNDSDSRSESALHRCPAGAARDPAPDISRSDCAPAPASISGWRTNLLPAEALMRASLEHLLRGTRTVTTAFRKELRRMPKCPRAG